MTDPIQITLGQSLIFGAFMAAFAGLVGFAAGAIYGLNKANEDWLKCIQTRIAYLENLTNKTQRRSDDSAVL